MSALLERTRSGGVREGEPGAAGWPMVRLVAEREVLVRLRDRTYLISTAVLIAIVAAAVAVPMLLAGSGRDDVKVGVVGDSARVLTSRAAALSDAAWTAQQRADASTDGVHPATSSGAAGTPTTRLLVTGYPTTAAAEAAVRDGTIDVAVEDAAAAAGTGGVTLVGESSVPADVADLVNRAQAAQQPIPAPAQRLLSADAANQDLALGLSYVAAFLFFLTVVGFGMQIAQSVTEEKQSRIVELLVTAVPVRVLLVGKILGNAVLALAQTVLLVAVGLAATSAAGQPGVTTLLLHNGGWFLLFFVLGFVMLACLWAAAGALAGRQEDLQSTTLPMNLLTTGPFILAVSISHPGTWMTVLSYVPFSSPLMMPRRLLLGDASWWEAGVAGLVLLGTAAALVWLGSRIYENALLRTGAKVGWKDAWRRTA